VNGSQQKSREGVVLPIAWKVLISLTSGGIVYLLTLLGHQSQEWNLLLAVFVGGVVLVVQFLFDSDRSLRNVQEGMAQSFLKINAATDTYSKIEASPVSSHIKNLIENITGLTDGLPDAALRLARSEIDSVAKLVKELSAGDAKYDGEDQDWMLTLVRNTSKTIDATSTTNIDGGGKNFDGGFWTSSLGQRYLGAQKEATTKRDVAIRRLFVLSPSEESDPEFQEICQEQAKAGIDVRVLDPKDIPPAYRSENVDLIIFDRTVSYEAHQASRFGERAKATVSETHLIVTEKHVEEKRNLFEELWNSGHRPTSATPAEPFEA
jgi:hypothetical protein